uniref:Myb-like domain-containing protein n=1 Tax=Timspurckia oligopyrenoides TaxID=708627 RepID=A0A7S0ZHF0_9RHOD|mmetsp:Transcript_5380/g.9475  ORF Transcript_5380/g.9475 Transcript_5380/m.9475 type:complete len:166 (+) Transcript_5380:248-745(+)
MNNSKHKEYSSLDRISIPNLVTDNSPPLDDNNNVIAQVPTSNAYPSRPKDPSKRWTLEDDEKVLNWVNKYGARKWSELSRVVFHGERNGAQLRGRFSDVLNPLRALKEWSCEEDQELLRIQMEVGNKWRLIADRMKGRCSNDVKNRFRLLIRNGTAHIPHNKPSQ